MKEITIPAIILGLTFGCTNLAHSAYAISNLASPSDVISVGSGGTHNFLAGYDITVGASDLSVSAIGYYDLDSDGLEDPTAEAGIFTLDPADGPNGVLLGKVTAGNSASSFAGGYRFVDLVSSFTLEAGKSYRIVASTGQVGATNDHNGTPLNGTPTFEAADFTLDTATFYSSQPQTMLIRPNSTSTPPIYLGNFQYTVVPEPSAALLGLVSLGFLIRRRR